MRDSRTYDQAAPLAESKEAKQQFKQYQAARERLSTVQYRGCILADMTGLGKTLATYLALSITIQITYPLPRKLVNSGSVLTSHSDVIVVVSYLVLVKSLPRYHSSTGVMISFVVRRSVFTHHSEAKEITVKSGYLRGYFSKWTISKVWIDSH